MRHYRGFWILLPALTLSCQTQAPDKVEIPPVNNTAHDLLPYPEPDAYLGESLHDGELDVAKKIPDVIHQNIRSQSTSEQRFQGKSLLTHGCVNAEFVVDPGINPALAKGVFSSQGAYEATVRFSGTNADPKSADSKRGGQTMAIKLRDVSGKKILSGDQETTTQDFVMIDHPIFFIADPKEYLSVFEKSECLNIFCDIPTLARLGIKDAPVALAMQNMKITSPIQTSYFTMLPFQLGSGADRVAVHYKAEPCSENGSDTNHSKNKSADYLRESMRKHFQTKDACFVIFAQVKTSKSMSVEDSRHEWKSPWQKMATLNMLGKNQEISENSSANDPLNQTCESLSFSAWHSLPEHRPLGAINRIGKVTYEYENQIRKTMENEQRLDSAR